MSFHRPKKPRGQTLVLGALSMLLLALMMAMSFSLTHAIHEKIRIQQHADAVAFSMATVEARVLNYLAYTNRAAAASFVSVATLHAYMSVASSLVSINQAAAQNYQEISGQERSCCPCCGMKFCPCTKHCAHAAEASGFAGAYSADANFYQTFLQGAEPQFVAAVTAFDLVLDKNYESQKAMVEFGKAVVSGSHLDSLNRQNAPHAMVVPGSKNVSYLGCALEPGPDVTSVECEPTCLKYTASAGMVVRSAVMMDIANAARPNWPASRTNDDHFKDLFKLRFRAAPNGMATLPAFSEIKDLKGTARAVETTSGLYQGGTRGEKGKMIAAEDKGRVETSLWFPGKCQDCAHKEPYKNDWKAHVESDMNGGGQSPGLTGTPHRFEGLNRGNSDCAGEGNCYIAYRYNDDPETEFGQPGAMVVVSQDLSLLPSGNRGPWELNSDGRLEFDHGGQGKGILTLRPPTGVAISKALAYYHRLGDWHEHPNSFNPFWRSKLHPWFGEEELDEILEGPGTEGIAPGLSEVSCGCDLTAVPSW